MAIKAKTVEFSQIDRSKLNGSHPSGSQKG